MLHRNLQASFSQQQKNKDFAKPPKPGPQRALRTGCSSHCSCEPTWMSLWWQWYRLCQNRSHFGVTSSLWSSNLDNLLGLHRYMELGAQPSQLARDVRMRLKSNLRVLREKILIFKHITMTWEMSSGRQVVRVDVKPWSLLIWWLCWRTQFVHWHTSHPLQCLNWVTWNSHRIRTIPRKTTFYVATKSLGKFR